MLSRVVWGAAVVVVVGCGTDPTEPTDQSATIAGRIIVAGPLRDARVSIDQVHVDDNLGGVRAHIGDTTTNAEGLYTLGDFGKLNGLFLVTASGGAFEDLVTGETIVLDPSEQIRTLVEVDLFEQRTGALVSPVGHLVEALARTRLDAGMEGNLFDARQVAAEHVHAHFGGLDWQRIDPAPLDQPAPSATDAVRAALIADAFSILSDDIATAASASPQEVNAYSLTLAWAADLEAAPFDGNDTNDRGHATGLQLGECAAVPADCIIRPSPPACSLGACREACDVYAGSPRSAFSGALLKLVRSSYNQTGITDTAILPLARAIADNADPVLFGDACRDSLDRTAPTLVFEAPSPGDGAHVRGTISVRVRAVDDIDPDPDLAWLGGLMDSDGDPTNAVATADVVTAVDGPLMVAAEAVDSAGNAATAARMFVVDNTPPVITVDPAGFYVAGADWWTASDAPTVSGTVTDSNLETVVVYLGAVQAGPAVVTGSSWSFTLPAGSIPGVVGSDVRVEAFDRAGNSASETRRIRHDGTSPSLSVLPSRVRDEQGDLVSFTRTVDLNGVVSHIQTTHNHQGSVVDLATSTACDQSASTLTVNKYIHLLDQVQPPYVTEVGAIGEDQRNPIRVNFQLVDDGVGIDAATVGYRVRDVALNTFPIDWTPIVGTGTYAIPLYRTGSTWPSVAALGTKEGVFEVQFRGSDHLGREVSISRCWQHRLLAPPVVLGPMSNMGVLGQCGMTADTSCAATHGPASSGKYALNLLSLGDTVPPVDPFATQVLNDGVAGTGLMQFPAWNASTSPIYLSVDLTNPSATYSKSGVENRWAFTQSSVNIDCDRVLVDGEWMPDTSRPNCESVSHPGGNLAGTTFSTSPTSSSPSYGVRIWEEVSSTNFVELTLCPGCSTMSSTNRLTVMLPARPPPNGPGDAAYPRKFWVVPVVKTISDLRPNGTLPYAEFTAAGVTMTGKVEETRSGCYVYVPQGADFICTTRRSYTRYRALQSASFSLGGNVDSGVFTSWSGLSGDVRQPPHLTSLQSRRSAPFTPLSTNEAALPPVPTL